jgi:hypothetical protein
VGHGDPALPSDLPDPVHDPLVKLVHVRHPGTLRRLRHGGVLYAGVTSPRPRSTRKRRPGSNPQPRTIRSHRLCPPYPSAPRAQPIRPSPM